MAIVGAYARIDGEASPEVRQRLSAFPNVELFDLADPGKVGLIVEAESLDHAYALVRHDLRRVNGVLGVWPVYVHTEDEFGTEEMDNGIIPA
jgi:nitrate reductase NapAB chaperone NapD